MVIGLYGWRPRAGEPGSHRYGMYGWRGVDTIGYTAVESAVQLVNGNETLKARVMTSGGATGGLWCSARRLFPRARKRQGRGSQRFIVDSLSDLRFGEDFENC